MHISPATGTGSRHTRYYSALLPRAIFTLGRLTYAPTLAMAYPLSREATPQHLPGAAASSGVFTRIILLAGTVDEWLLSTRTCRARESSFNAL